MDKIQEIQERLSKTSEGTWFYEEDEYSWDLYTHVGGAFTMPLKLIKAPKKSREYAEYYPKKADADFIAHAKVDIQFLLSEVERLQEQIRSMGMDNK